MRLKSAVLCLLVFLLAFSAWAAEAPSPSACEDKVTAKWVQMLEDLKRFETLYTEKDWNLLKYWETVYDPLWQASLKRQDPYSQARKAEGEMLSKRYQDLAESYLALAEEARTDMKKKIKDVRQGLKDLPKCCDSADYRICMAPRRQDVEIRLDELMKFLKAERTDEDEFSSRMRASVDEKPSDHDALVARYGERFQKMETEARFKFMEKLRAVREKLEVGWPGDACCKKCTPAAQSVSNDPVLARVKPDPQGNAGVAGKIVNNASVVDAFDRFEKQKKGQTRS